MAQELTILDLIEHAAEGHRTITLTAKQCQQLLDEVEELENDAYDEGKNQGQLNTY